MNNKTKTQEIVTNNDTNEGSTESESLFGEVKTKAGMDDNMPAQTMNGNDSENEEMYNDVATPKETTMGDV